MANCGPLPSSPFLFDGERPFFFRSIGEAAGIQIQCLHVRGTISEAPMSSVSASEAALELLAEIVERHGPVIFHQSGGCCDGSAPMCYPAGEFRIGERDVKLGTIGGMDFYMSGSQYEVWKHTDLVIDAIDGRGGMFSLDNGTERRFLTRSNLCARD